MRRYCGRGPALAAALQHLLRRPLRLLVVATALALPLGLAELALQAWSQAPATALGQPRPVVSVLMPVGAGSPEAAHVREVLQHSPLVASLRFVPREASLTDLSHRPALSALSAGESRGNPLPDAWVATLLPSATPDEVDAAIAQWRKDSWVGSVEFDPLPWQRWTTLRRLVSFGATVLASWLGAALLLGLGACAGSGPVLAAAQRRVLLDLGASPAGLRRAFVYAAAAQALLAGLLGGAFALLAGNRLVALAADYAEAFGLASPVVSVPSWLVLAGALALVLLAALVAALGARWMERAA